MTNKEPDIDSNGVIAFTAGVHFQSYHYDQWKAEIALWITQTQPHKLKKDDPISKAERILKAAINGTKVDGNVWLGVEKFSLKNRIKLLSGWDIKNKVGRQQKAAAQKGPKHPENVEARHTRKVNEAIRQDISLQEMYVERDRFKKILLKEFPQIDNPVYETQINALTESMVKLKNVAHDFLIAKGKDLESLAKVRDQLKKDINDFQMQLKIHPSQLKEKVDELERGDLGGLILKWESYGEVADIYEQVDAIQELVQSIHQVESLRVDNSPQLADYLLYHKTGCKPYRFTCKCGLPWEIYNGFTKEELYAAAEQAFKVFGFGIEKIEYNRETAETETIT